MTSHKRGSQSLEWLKLSHDRKVSPSGWLQKAHGRYPDRWVPDIPNSFGLPSGLSCPGLTPFCESCYANNTENYSPGVRDLVTHNFNLLKDASVDRMVELLDEAIGRFWSVCEGKNIALKDRLFRIHWDGDFFSEDYARAWVIVMRKYSHVSFWTYTRSFVGTVNVVPILVEAENLALYLSADQYNMEAAKAVVGEFPKVLLALCAEDYASGRELTQGTGRKVLVCPENSGRMPLVSDKGRGACIDCRLCPDAKRDVIFSTSHLESVPLMLPFPGVSAGRCANPECNNKLIKKAGPGRPPKYCSPPCRWKMYRRGQKPKVEL